MKLLINKDTVAVKLQVAIGYSDKDFETFINEAQEFDLKPLVEEDFYFDLLSKNNEQNYAKLISGGNYEYKNRTYNFQGLETVLSYFAYSRFVMSSSAISTSHGMVVKTTPNSTPLSLEERKNFYYKKKTEANALMVDCVKFIERNIGSFPSWKNDSCQIKKTTGFQTRVIK